ncbi:MAG: NAD(P)H-dependent oxidoreductase [Pseudomonadota bacterium]
MKHAIIVGHPDPDSFTLSVARAYVAAVERLGHTTRLRDLYRLDFDPRLTLAECRDSPADDALAERRAIADADVFVFIYPFWFNTPPAIVKGYVERVFGAGFGYARQVQGGQGPLLAGRRLLSFTSSGSSRAWLEEQGAWLSLKMLFDDYLARLCGLEVIDHVHFASVTADLEPRWVEENLALVAAKVAALFGGR